ncbi:MAG: AAA family ATPase [Gemmatimonadaceae bacterium]|nr:AAA family ATPase [Gemmatimonadaceae bacterium]MCW5825181.1 AAA family ATPase [Gemmatimonadaceae bacterium]
MEPIDSALQRFSQLHGEIELYKKSVVSEQDTRVKVIDRILSDVLGWTFEDIMTESMAGSGYIDYRLCNQSLTRVIVEAKRDGLPLLAPTARPGRSYKLSGPIFKEAATREGLQQAIRYCGMRNAELAVVTNGHEWIVFRGSRLGDGRDTLDGMAFVFPGYEAIKSEFALFWALLSPENVAQLAFRAHFQEAEGRPLRTHEFRRALRNPDSRVLLAQSTLMSDIERVMTSFFRRLSGDDDPDLLAKCFVVSRESQHADERLARISDDLLGRIKNLDTDEGRELSSVISRVRDTGRNEFVLLIGTKGAGKSTFIDRFFKFVLPRPLAGELVVARINLADSDGNDSEVSEWLNRRLLSALEQAVFGEKGPSFDELKGMFFDEYKRRSEGTLKYLYESDKVSFQIDFGRMIEERRETRPHEYIKRLLQHIVNVRRMLPCLVFDNADHFTIEFQERVFQYARSLYESELSLVVMPITDRTSWQLSREGALRSFENESLFLPTPLPMVVLKKRIEFLESRLHEEKREPGRGYFIGRGISLSLDNLTAFTAALQGIFLKSGDVAYWIGNLANNDVRRCLELAKYLVSSPRLEVAELLKTYIAGSSIVLPAWRVKKALVNGRYDIFSSTENTFVRNVFALDEDLEHSPLLGLRLLQVLRDTSKHDPTDPFMPVEHVIDYFRAMHVEPRATTRILGKMLEYGLCGSYDPTITEIAKAKRVELTPAGFQHLRWGTRDQAYISEMLLVTPIASSEAHASLAALQRQSRKVAWAPMGREFVRYVCSEDEKYCRVPAHPAYDNQSQLVAQLRAVYPEEDRADHALDHQL